MNNILLNPISVICKNLRDPITCSPEAPVKEVLTAFQDNKIGCVIVVDAGKIVGIFTERDYIQKIAGSEDLILDSFSIQEYMTRDPQTVIYDSEVLLGLNYMRVGKYRHLVVVDEHGKLKKVLSIKDFLDYLVDQSDLD